MSLEDAARWTPQKQNTAASAHDTYHWDNFRYGGPIGRTTGHDLRNETFDKARWLTAVREAQERGLDWTKARDQTKDIRPRSSSNARRHPAKHAEILLKETSLTFHDIAEITGLDVIKIVTIKLKLRNAA